MCHVPAVSSRFKAYKKYMYQYTTESRNGVTGTANLRNGPKVTCQVEIEVPQPCRFIMYTRDCFLGEVSVMDARGRPVYTQAPGSEDFRDVMERNPLKFTVGDVAIVQLYPKEDEPVNIVNIKRGIISALMVPVIEEDQGSSSMSTVHGRCLTVYEVNTRRDVPTDVTLTRDLSQCDQFYSRQRTNSPLALLQKLHSPMSKLISSSQKCNYQFDSRRKHITAAMCSEEHLYLPFSSQDNGISSVVSQELSVQNVRRSNNRTFDVNFSQARPLYFEGPDDKGPVQTKDAVLSTLRELASLAGTGQGQKRTGLFHKLVTGMRVLRNKTLSRAVPEMRAVSGWLTLQALFQCGTADCTSAILQIIRTMDGVSLELDALVYGLSLQPDPDAARVRDMLSMAQYRQSKAIMYALANTVKNFHKGPVTPEVTDVSQFMETLLNDCSTQTPEDDTDIPPDPAEKSFLVLRVVGVMGRAMQAVGPGLVSSILNCVKKTDIPLSNQKAAIQAFRTMTVDGKVRDVLMDVFRDPRSPVEKRIAALLVLMKNPEESDIRDIISSVGNIRDGQLRSYVVSYLNNIHNSDEPQTSQLRKYIEAAVNSLPPSTAFDGMSRSYKLDSPLGSIRSGVIFDGHDTLPKEILLETTLKVFDFSQDLFEVSIEGTGFEPTVDALFGQRGFFPETISRVMNMAEDNVQILRDILDRMMGPRGRVKRQEGPSQTPQNHWQDVADNIQRLVDDVHSHPAPEATAYLRLLGNEIGYMKSSEVRKILETVFLYYHAFTRILPAQAFLELTSRPDNEVFAHYIFMESAFSLPTASGFPLKFSLAGVFAPGARGGLTPAAVTDFSFMPSVGLEFITHMGVHVPDYVDAGIQMCTNLHHQSSLNGRVTLNRNQIRLSIPAPKANTQLFSVSNQLLSISSGQTNIVPSLVEDRIESTGCQPLVSGLKLCTIVHYSNATSTEQAPYYPLTGETRFAVEIQPTGTVSEYTATIRGETLREGQKGHHKVESLTLSLKAEGDDSSEITASLKYNRNKNVFSTEVVIPNYDVEAGITLAVTDGGADRNKMRGITVDVTNKNIPQLTLVGHARHNMMRDAMLKLQMIIPSLKTDASITANLRKDEYMLMDVETVVHLPETSYKQKASLKYDDDKFEVELESYLNSDVQNMLPNAEDHRRWLQQVIDDILDQRVAKTDMKMHHIVTKGIEAGNIWLDKMMVHFPGLEKLQSKRSLSDLTLPALPEKLFLQSNSLFRYEFNKNRMAISFPLPFGGKKSTELNIPNSLSVPVIDVPQIGLYIPAKRYSLLSFTIPSSVDFTIPLLGLVEASTKISSNFYTWEGSFSGGNNTIDVPSYVAQYNMMASSPCTLLSYRLQGSGMISGKADNSLKYLLNNSFSHILIDMSVSVIETLRVTDKFNARANYKMEASSPLGLEASLYYSAQSTSTLNSDEVSGDGTVDGRLGIGSFYANTSYTHRYNLRPLDREGKGESTMIFDSPFIEIQNIISGKYANSELNILSKTSTQEDIVKHIGELRYKDGLLTLKSSAIAAANGKVLNNKVMFGVSSHMASLRIESQAEDGTNGVYSLIAGAVDSNGLEVNSMGSIIFETARGLHKVSLTVGRDGLSTNGTNSLQFFPMTIENVFNAAIDSNGATLSCTTKAMGKEGRGELNLNGKITADEASFYGNLMGHAYEAAMANNMNIVLNRKGLIFTGDSKGTLRQMKTENSHVLTLTLWTFNLRSKSDNRICEDIYYKQDSKVDMKPFVVKVDMINDLRLYDARLNNEGHMKLEPKKMELSGSVMGSYGDDHNIKHKFEVTYDDMAGTVKCDTSGIIMDIQLSHSCEVEFAGLSSISKCEAQFKSEPFNFDGTIRTMALPFSLSVDAAVNTSGVINLHGRHTGQTRCNLAVKAEPLALAYEHISQISTTHKLPSRESTTNFKSKCKGLLTPNNQSLAWKLQSKLINHVYNQDISAYNNPEKAGVEFSAVMVTDIFSKYQGSQPDQEFSVTGFLKYDKSSDCHVIELPFIESFPAAFELLKNNLVQALESLQQFIQDLDINQLITDFKATLDRLPGKVSNFMQEMDLENKIDQMKAELDYWINEFSVTVDDLEIAVKNWTENVETTVKDMLTQIRNLILIVKDHIKEGRLSEKISNSFSFIVNLLRDFDSTYKIKQSFVKLFSIIEDIIREIDLKKLKLSSAEFLQRLDAKYAILKTVKDKLSEIKKAIENFDIFAFLQDVKEYLLSVDWAWYVEQLSYNIPSAEIAKVMESMNDVIVNWIDEYEILNKLNAVYFSLRDLLLNYDLDNTFKQMMDQTVLLIKEFKIKQTMQSIVDAMKSIKFEYIHESIMRFLSTVTSWFREIDFKKSIDDLNEHVSSLLKAMKEFDYNTFVDKINKKITELTNHTNDQIKRYEIVEKIEAVRDYLREIQTSIYTYLEELKKTKVADALKKLKSLIDATFYNDFKVKVQDMLEDARQRILDMDIRGEMYIYLQRASESYSNMVAFFSAKFNQMIEGIGKLVKGNKIINQIKDIVNRILNMLKKGEIEVPMFTVPLTDLTTPAFTINLNKLHDISIPTRISLPEFTFLNCYTAPTFTIDVDEIKAKIIAIIDEIRDFEIQTRDPEEIFGDLKVLYLCKLPDFTFPEITLSEIIIPTIKIPKLKLEDFEIKMLSIPEIQFPEIPHDICIPVFNKLHGEFTIKLPHYTLITKGKLENATSTVKNPQFTATLTSHATSAIQPLEYNFEATALVEAPRLKKLQFTETMKASHMAFSVDHEGSLTLTGTFVDVSAKTSSKATTQVYTAELVNDIELALKNGISASTDTTYNHKLDLPSCEISSQTSVKQHIAVAIEPGKITLTSRATGNGKWSIHDYSDEGTHKSNMEIEVNFSTAKLAFVGETDCKALKAKQTVTAESVFLNLINVEATCTTDIPSFKTSTMVLKGKADVGELKIALTASHDTEFTEHLTGSMSNSLDFIAHPFEIVLDVENKLNAKIFFPLKLKGKVDLQHDCGVLLNSEKQHITTFTLVRFNQYKYTHNCTSENNEKEKFFHCSANGEANLDFLTIPISIPAVTIPHLGIKTPEFREFSLWENAELKTLLTTPQQSFDMNLKLHYHKNPDTHTFSVDLNSIYRAISSKANIIQAQFEACRDIVVSLLKNSHNQARSQYIRHKINTSALPPRIFRIPGYKTPIVNIEVSSFSVEMPVFSYFVPKEVSTPSFRVPALGFSVPSYTLVLPSLKFLPIHVPDALSELKLPTFTLPDRHDGIQIPALGNITFDFSFIAPMITFSTNAGLYNQTDIVARLSTSSVSVFDILNVKINGTTSFTKKRMIKLATTVTLDHNNMNNMTANHKCYFRLTKQGLEASVASMAKINLPFLHLELTQETGNTNTKLFLSSKKKINYAFYIPLTGSTGKGNLDMNWDLEKLSSPVLLETSTKGETQINIFDGYTFLGDLENKASFYLSANRLHSTVNTALNSNVFKEAKQKRSPNNVFLFDLKKDLAFEVSLRRMFATVDFTSNNKVDSAPFSTIGKHIVKGKLDFVNLTTFKTTLKTDSSQPSNLGDVGLIQSISLALSLEKQSFTWSSREQVCSLIHSFDFLMSNDESEVHMHLTESVKGHFSFLKSVKLPIYQKTLWDVLRFDQVTTTEGLQYLNISSSVIYSKSMDGYKYSIPYRIVEDAIVLSIPEVNVTIPSWVKEIPKSIKNIDMQFENSEVPDHLTLPPAIPVPFFKVPFTNLHVGPFRVYPKNLNIPKKITTKAFEVNLPGLLRVSVPSFVINTEYLSGKCNFLSFKIPQYFITNHISNFELLPIATREQRIEIPEVTLYLPLSVFIPTFGALSINVKVSSSIYNVDTTASVEKRNSNLITFLDSVCISTIDFLKYELSASATLGYNNGVMNLNGKGNLIHNDVNVNWLYAQAQSLRGSYHSLNIDVTSRTFTDVILRIASRKDVISASVSSPSSGFLGLHIQQRSPSQLYGKFFGRYPSSPEKDIDAVTAKVSLRNSDKLVVQVSWNWDFLHDVAESTKDRIPAMTDAMYKFINKYHTSLFGFDLNRGGMKLRNAISNAVETAYQMVPMLWHTLQDLIQNLINGGKELYKKMFDGLMSFRVQDTIVAIHKKARQFKHHCEDKMNSLHGAVTRFLRATKLPGSDGKLSIMEALQEADRSLSSMTNRALQWLSSLMDSINAEIRNIRFTLPGTDIVNGDKLAFPPGSVYDNLREFVIRVVNVDAIYEEILQSVKNHSEEAQRKVAENENLIKHKIKETLNALSVEKVNERARKIISFLQEELHHILNKGVDLLSRESQNTAPYLRVSHKKMDIEIPLPFLWKSFRDWPKQLQQ
ncbi:apolipoprotein B-100 [Pholidichthys leucotaenia]